MSYSCVLILLKAGVQWPKCNWFGWWNVNCNCLLGHFLCFPGAEMLWLTWTQGAQIISFLVRKCFLLSLAHTCPPPWSIPHPPPQHLSLTTLSPCPQRGEKIPPVSRYICQTRTHATNKRSKLFLSFLFIRYLNVLPLLFIHFALYAFLLNFSAIVCEIATW